MRNTLFVVILLVLSLLLIQGCNRTSSPQPEELEIEEVNEENEENKENEEMKTEDPIVKIIPPIVVVINNHPAARPQSGLQQASLVYEFLVEGGVTRFLAVFNQIQDQNYIVGPVRSLRPYLAYQALEHGGIIVHSGYSDRTKNLIKNLPLKHRISTTYLWRDSSRKAPHNLYSDTDRLLQAIGSDTSFTDITPRPPKLPAGYSEGKQIEVNYSKSNIVSYTYNEDEESYGRFINSAPQTDRETEQPLTIRRVILRSARHTAVTGTNLIDIELPGTGEGLLFEEGRQYTVTWKQVNGLTHYYYEDNSPVDLSYGNTWVQVIR